MPGYILLFNMSEDKPTTRHFISKKCYEVAYALFRISSRMESGSLADAIERRGIAILEAAEGCNFPIAESALGASERFLRFGSDVGLINQANAEMIVAEIRNLNSAIAGLTDQVGPAYIDLDGVFSKETRKEVEGAPINSHNEDLEQNKLMITESKDAVYENNDQIITSGHGLVNSAMRQSAILERIRQNGSCRLKELQELLPEASERTLRYDVQNLMERGLLERIGSGGPATHYKAKEQPPVEQ
jgi:Fic family protein